MLTATSVWLATPELIVALDGRFGEPVTDAYVNGSQVWLGGRPRRADPRMAPAPRIAGYQRPASVGTYDVFSRTALRIRDGGDAPAPLRSLWQGLEAFSAYGEDRRAGAAVRRGRAVSSGSRRDASGLVDHEAIGDEWETQRRPATSIIAALIAQLRS